MMSQRLLIRQYNKLYLNYLQNHAVQCAEVFHSNLQNKNDLISVKCSKPEHLFFSALGPICWLLALGSIKLLSTVFDFLPVCAIKCARAALVK